MKGPLKLVAPLVVALGVVACSAGGSSNIPAGTGLAGLQAAHMPMWALNHTATPACAGSRTGQAQCDVLIETNAHQMGGHQAYGGWGAPNLEKAYNLPITKGKGQNVFIVDAYDNPDVSSDFNTYRSTMGLPASTLNKYNQTGQKSNYPQNSPGWGVEIDLDVDMASASCPTLHDQPRRSQLQPVERLEAAEQEAVKLGGTVVSNSYDGTGATESDYDTKGVTYLASAGDAGYGLYDPATFDSVIAVGGTFLNSARRQAQVHAKSSGRIAAAAAPAPVRASPHGRKIRSVRFRTGNDIGAVSVGAAEYDTDSEGGWIEVDGTSISSPLVAGMVALAGNSTKQDGGENLWKLTKKQQKKSIYPVVTGNLDGCPPVSAERTSAMQVPSSSASMEAPTVGEPRTESAPSRQPSPSNPRGGRASARLFLSAHRARLACAFE